MNTDTRAILAMIVFLAGMAYAIYLAVHIIRNLNKRDASRKNPQ